MQVLLVEDDVYKSDDIKKTFFNQHIVHIARSVKEAVCSVEDGKYDLIVLDMALPTFRKQVKSAGGTTQASGGVEVIRSIQRTRIASTVVIVSQYPDLEIDGKYLPLEKSADFLLKRYRVNVVGAIRYDFDDKGWVKEFEMLTGCARE